MSLFLNITIYIVAFILFSLSIFGHGYFIKNILIKKTENNYGEIGIFGFITLYLLTTLIHFFFPLNQLLTLFILLIGIVISSYFIFKNKNQIRIKKRYIFIFLLFLIAGATNSYHDDTFFYQLPYISYIQNSKIVFGLINLNEFTAYSNGFYSIMALFKLPLSINNQLVFLVPVIFLMFFSFFLSQNLKKNKALDIFIYIIFLVIALRFSRTKEYGTDIPVTALIFMLQVYLLTFLKNKDLILFYKSLIIFSFTFFLKVYSIFSAIYLIIYLPVVFKNYKKVIKKYYLILFLFLITISSLTKNIIQSGCLAHPVKITCVKNETIFWGLDKEIVEYRNDTLVAGTRGIKAYIRSNNIKDGIYARDYLNKFKYNYHKNVIKDPDFDRILIIFLIFIILILYSNKLDFRNYFKINNNSDFNFKYTFLIFIPTVIWWIYIPISKYGGYAYLTFGLFAIFFSLNILQNLNYKNLNRLLFIAVIFFISKNTIRIANEYTAEVLSTKNYPYPFFKNKNYKTKSFNSFEVNVTNDWNYCGDIKFPCVENLHFEALSKIFYKNGYTFFISDKNKKISNINIEQNRMLYKINN